MRRALFIFALIFISFGFTIPPAKTGPIKLYKDWDLNTSQEKMDRAIRKDRNSKYPDMYRCAQMYFSKAYIAYINQDTSYKQFFALSADKYKKASGRICKNMNKKYNAIFMIGLSYYYLNNYEDAGYYLKKASYLSKWLPETNADVWIAKCLIRTNRLDSAKMVLNNFCSSRALNKDSIAHLVNVDIKNGH